MACSITTIIRPIVPACDIDCCFILGCTAAIEEDGPIIGRIQTPCFVIINMDMWSHNVCGVVRMTCYANFSACEVLCMSGRECFTITDTHIPGSSRRCCPVMTGVTIKAITVCPRPISNIGFMTGVRTGSVGDPDGEGDRSITVAISK